MTVVPDSIEPYIGYKALRVLDNGVLASPQQNTIWPPKERLEAYCTAKLSNWSWTPIEGEPRETEAITPFTTFGGYPTGVPSSSTNFPMRPTRPPKPSNPLPPGWNWSWEPLGHDVPSEGCGCGIYAVSEPKGCDPYMHVGCFIVEVAVWGKTITAHHGARGQYAYPRRMLIPKSAWDGCRMTSLLYGIPAVLLPEDTLEEPVRENVKKWAEMQARKQKLAPRIEKMQAARTPKPKTFKDWLRR